MAGAAAGGAQRSDGGGGTFNLTVRSSVRAGFSWSRLRATQKFFEISEELDLRRLKPG